MSLTSTNIKKYLKSKDSSFKLFDIKYTEEEKQTINNFKIDNEINFSYKISADKKYYQLLYKFIESIGNNDEKDITIIINIIYKLLDTISKAWNSNITLNIQIMLPNNKPYLPVWHIDNINGESNLKFITVLRGSGTLFIDNNKAKKAYFEIEDLMINEIQNKKKLDIIKFFNKYDKIKAKKLGDYKIVQPKNNQGIIFSPSKVQSVINGLVIPERTNASQIHAVPNIKEKRFFISIQT